MASKKRRLQSTWFTPSDAYLFYWV